MVLAAGASTRLGTPKQLLQLNGQPLLNIVLREVENADVKNIILVLGSSYEIIKDNIDEMKVHIIYNENWTEGMASSMIVGLKAALELDPAVEGVIFVVCDQPFISASLLDGLIEKHQQSGLPIVASSYAETLGTPAYFHKSLFPELMLLSGDSGAKKILQKYSDEVAAVEFSRGSIDIDTNEDLQYLKESL
ncbi:MAG: nucleotidyltransferase family protein [Flavitalea sp.]